MDFEDSTEPRDYQAEVLEYTSEITTAAPDRENVNSELEALQSIYGDNAIRTWKSPSEAIGHAWSPDEPIRFELVTALSPPHDDVDIHILVTLSPSYPQAAPPQLQLLSRYIGAFSIDATLFGTVLRTYLSTSHGVEWTPGEVAVFDGIESVKEQCAQWYGEQLSRDKAGELLREHEKEQERALHLLPDTDTARDESNMRIDSHVPPVPAQLPEGASIVISEPIVDRKSVFIGRACRISHPSHVPQVVAYLLSDRRIAKAAHPVIRAWRCQVGNLLHQDNDDDGESAAGGRLSHLLQILDVNNVLVVVTRYWGGIHLGPDRFKHINQAARDALEVGGFLEEEMQHAKARNKKRR